MITFIRAAFLLIVTLTTSIGIARAQSAADGSQLSMLTYNVKGLPWPLATGRPKALAEIASQLMAMRRDGRQPHLIAVQEAFLPEAKAIGSKAGYPYVAFGPAESDTPVSGIAADQAFAKDAGYLSGERSGKRTDSGLAIFSDYPIVAVRRIAYPVCAGYDCLANKGAVAATIALPGAATPIIVVTTHLNSNSASGVSKDRALYAFERQIDILARFVADQAQSGSPVMIAGDFNVGHNAARRDYFAAHMLGGVSAARSLCDGATQCSGDVADSLAHGKDWLLFRSSANVAITPLDLSAPVNRGGDGKMLSDHVGLEVTYRLAPSATTGAAALTVASR
jgi:endonuclease/exonuclease/phosphatase family metal-dependent hydrolase